MKNWLGEKGNALIGVSAASFLLIEFSNDLEAVGRTGVVYWNWVLALGDNSKHCKTNGQRGDQREGKERVQNHRHKTTTKAQFKD